MDDHACLAGLAALWDKARRTIRQRAEIVRVGVTLGDLSPANARQLDLFLNDDRQRQRCEALTHVIDRLNRKFGKRVLTLGPWMLPPGATCLRCLHVWLQSPVQLLLKVDHRDVRLDEVAKNLACRAAAMSASVWWSSETRIVAALSVACRNSSYPRHAAW